MAFSINKNVLIVLDVCVAKNKVFSLCRKDTLLCILVKLSSKKFKLKKHMWRR